MFRTPNYAQLPHITTLIDKIPASHRQIAQHLGITPRTLQRYISTGNAPKLVMLALFWESDYGLQTANITAQNHAQHYAQMAEFLKQKNRRLVKQILTLENEIKRQNHSANSPFFRIG